MIKNLPGRNPKTKGLQTSPQAPNKMKTLKTKIIFIKRLKKYTKYLCLNQLSKIYIVKTIFC